MAGALDQHGVVVRSDNCSGKAIATVQADTVATSRAVYLELTSIGREALGGVFGGDTALDGETTDGDTVLGQAELLEGSTCGNLNLSCDNIDAGNLLSDGVLDLDSRVDLDEVVSVLLVDQELGSTGIAVVDRLGELDSISQDGVASLDRQVLCRGKLNDLLVTSLNGAVTLVKVDDVAVAVTKELNLNVLGLIQETLDEDSAVAEGRLSLRCSSLERVLEFLLVANNSHTTTTTSEGGLDDDRKAEFVSEFLDLFKSLDRPLGTRDDRHVALDGGVTGRDLVAESINGFWGRSDELRASC